MNLLKKIAAWLIYGGVHAVKWLVVLVAALFIGAGFLGIACRVGLSIWGNFNEVVKMILIIAAITGTFFGLWYAYFWAEKVLGKDPKTKEEIDG